jgi:titin
VSWTNVPADAVLVLERSVAGADDFQPCGTFYSGTTTFADYLEVGTNYVYRARAIVTPDLASGWTTLPVNLALPAPNLTLHVDTAAFDHVDLSWTGVPAAATSVTIERALVGDSDFWPVATLTPTATAWTDTGVTEGLAYVYRLRAGNDHAISPPSDAATARANLPPAFYPFFLVPGSAAIAVAYGDASEHELGYRVERSSDGGAHYQVLAESFEYGDFPAYEDFTAAENTTYTYRVTAVGAFADSAAFTATITTGLWSPYGLAVTVLSPTSAHFTWIDNSEHETWFSVSVQAVDGTYHSPPIFLPANTTEYNVTGLTPGKAYTFSVSSDARWMTLDYGPVELPLAMPGLAPADPRAATGPTTAHLAWTDLTSDETAWRIQRSDDGGNTFTTLTDLPAGSQSFDDASLLPGYTYTYRVFAITGGPDGAAATLTVTTAPTAPVLVRAVDLSPDVISLTWDPLAPDVESLDIVYLSPKDGKIHTMARVTDPSLGHARVWALEDGSSFDNLTYTVWLVANGPGGSTASNAITVDTRIHTLSLTIASTGPTSVDLSWVDLYPQPGEVYGLWYSTDGVTYTQCLPESGATTATLTGLQSDTTYWFRLGRWDSWAGHASLADPVMAHTSPA